MIDNSTNVHDGSAGVEESLRIGPYGLVAILFAEGQVVLSGWSMHRVKVVDEYGLQVFPGVDEVGLQTF